MDILFVTRWSPRFDGGGTQQRAALHLRALAGLGRVHMLYIGGGSPVFDEATLRHVQQVVTLQSAGLAGAAVREPFSSGLVRRRLSGAWGVSGWLAVPRPAEAAALRASLRTLHFDLVFAFHVGSALVADAVVPPATVPLRIIDWDFVESVNVEQWSRRGAERFSLPRRIAARFAAWKVHRLEQRIFSSWSLHLCSSPADVQYLQLRAPAAHVAAIENACQAPEYKPEACRNDIPTVIFVGTMAYWPNLDAAVHFIDDVWPMVRHALPSAQLSVVGRAIPAALLERAGRDGVEMHCDVPELRPFYAQAHVAVVPLRYAVGSNLKIPEAMAYARPVVGYRLACERTGLGAPHGIFGVDTAKDLATTLIEMLEDRQRSADAGALAWAAAREHLAQEVIENKLRTIARQVLPRQT